MAHKSNAVTLNHYTIGRPIRWNERLCDCVECLEFAREQRAKRPGVRGERKFDADAAYAKAGLAAARAAYDRGEG